MEYIICIRCANIYQAPQDNQFRCPNCSFTVEKEFYFQLINYAQDAAKYGYVYRITYENEYKQDKTLPSRFQLSVDEILVFCALAALSGIIGNTAYDVLKGVMKKIINQFTTKQKRDDIDKTREIVNNSDQFAIFIQYITDFYNGMSNINPKIRDAISEEIFVDDFCENMLPLLMDRVNKSNNGKRDASEITQMLETQAKEYIPSRKTPPKKGDFDEFWQLFE